MQKHTKPWGAVIMASVVAAWVGLWAMPAIAKFLAPVEVTGQTQCWDQFGTGLPSCTNTGQDGDIQAGVRVSSPPRFTDNADGTVTDTLTGLIWLKDAGCLGDTDGLTWEDALAAVTNLARNRLHRDRCGLRERSGSDLWRLPNIKELESLIHFSHPQSSPLALPPGHPFVNVELRPFKWSSTTRVDQAHKAWGVHMEEGITVAHFKFPGICGALSENASFGVWAVKGPVLGGQFAPAPVEVTGQTQCWDPQAMSYLEEMSCPIDKIDCNDPRAKGQDGRLQAGVRPPTPRFDDLDDGTVLDRLTGLIWLKDANCLGRQSWQEALDVVAVLNLNPTELSQCRDRGGYTGMFKDWRLPNVKELQSLIDFGHSSPALPPDHRFDPQVVGKGAFYHSSTTRERFPDDAWAVSLREGITHPEPTEGGPVTAECQAQEPPPCVCSRFTEEDKGRCAMKHERRRVWAVRGGDNRAFDALMLWTLWGCRGRPRPGGLTDKLEVLRWGLDGLARRECGNEVVVTLWPVTEEKIAFVSTPTAL